MTEPESLVAPAPPIRYATPPAYAFIPPAIPLAPGGAPLADIWERFVAYVVDTAIHFAANLIPVAVFFVIVFGRFRSAFDKLQLNQQAVSNDQVANPWSTFRHLFLIELIGLACLIPISLVISYVYYVKLSYRTGQTVGKRVMKIKVVRATDGSPVTEAILRRRWVVFYVSAAFAPYFSYADGLWLLWDKPYQQCLHDKCADTVVVKSRP